MRPTLFCAKPLVESSVAVPSDNHLTVNAICGVLLSEEETIAHGSCTAVPRPIDPNPGRLSAFVTPIQGLYDYIASTTPSAKAGATGAQYTCTITSISVTGNAASVEMAMDGYHEPDFVDYFQLLKVDGRWWIVSKLFHTDPQSA